MQSKISFLLPFILIILSITYFLSGEDGHKSKKNKKKYRSLQSESNILRSDTISTNFMELGLVDEELFSSSIPEPASKIPRYEDCGCKLEGYPHDLCHPSQKRPWQ